MPKFGRKSAQFVDLLGYVSLKTPATDERLAEFVQKATQLLHDQNLTLDKHPNGSLYKFVSSSQSHRNENSVIILTKLMFKFLPANCRAWLNLMASSWRAIRVSCATIPKSRLRCVAFVNDEMECS